MTTHYAHARAGRPSHEWHPLRDHLRDVAHLAAAAGAGFEASDCARLAGLWHDVGKYSSAFQD